MKDKRFENIKKLGFLRFIEIIWILNVAGLIISSAFMIKGSFTADFHNFVEFINMLTDAVCVALLIKRKKITKNIAISLSILNIAIGYAYMNATTQIHSGDFISWIVSSVWDIVIILYFTFSKRVKVVLTEPFNLDTRQADLEKDANFYNLKSIYFWRNLVMYFCIFSIVGHWMEAAYCTLIRFGFIPGIYDPNSQIWHDWLYPFVVYGFGVVACVLLLYPLKNFLVNKFRNIRGLPLLLSFIANALVCTSIELVMGLMLNQPDANGVFPLWDYSDMFCNFMGQICLQNALAFGFIATLMTWLIYPELEKLIARIPRDAGNIIFIIIIIFFTFLSAFYLISLA